jgi:outer membrane lipoprotein SlyB
VGAAATTTGQGRTGAIVGGAVGGGAGAAIGQEVGGTKGAVIGAGVGGAAGSAIGRDLNRGNKQQASGATVVQTQTVQRAQVEEHGCGGKPHPKGWAKGWAKKGC